MSPTLPWMDPFDRTPAARGARRAAGFSLVELVVVVMIVGLMVGAISISWEVIVPRSRLNTSVRELAAHLQSTRSEAVSRNLEYWVEYDLDEEAYRVVTPFRLGGGRLALGASEDDRVRFMWHPLRDGVEFDHVTVGGDLYTEGSVVVRFDPLGASSDHSVVLSQPAYKNSYTLEVLALTGLIRFHDGIYEREAPDDGDFQ